jgi:hypothetical protein
MKKIIALLAFSLLAATQVFAAGNSITMATDLTSTSAKTGLTLYGDKTTATNQTTLIGKTSTGVALGAMSGAGGYALITQHKSGNRAFATSYDSTSVFYKDATVGTAVLAVPTKTDSSDFSAWTSM